LVDAALSGIGIAFIGLALLLVLVRDYPVQIFALAALALGTCVFVKRSKAEKRASELERAMHSADQQIERHRNALIGYYRQSLSRDQFGNEDTRAWQKWITTFVETQVRPELEKLGMTVDENLLERVNSHVDRCVREIAKANRCADVADSGSEILTPIDYERNCASSLFRCGWAVHPTPPTGDNGADVIADKAGKRLIVQCKLYSQPVGNKAVQEAYSALRLYNGTHACVVAPNGFTAQAKRAAQGLSVRLLHHSQLEAFADELVETQNKADHRAAL
jgi:restriction system protein